MPLSFYTLRKLEQKLKKSGQRIRVCETMFSEHEARLKLVNSAEDEMQCLECGSARVEPYALDPDGPVDSPFEDEEEPGMA